MDVCTLGWVNFCMLLYVIKLCKKITFLFKLFCQSLKGIVLRDWGGLQMFYWKD